MIPRALRIARTLAPLCAAALVGCSADDTSTTTSGAGGAGADAAAPVVFGPLGKRPDLPVDAALPIANLEGPVDVVRDKWGRPHIYANSVKDAMRVEGFLVARDRHFQLELMRRASEGRLAEILASADSGTIDTDIALRHVGLGRTAKAEWDALPDGEAKDILLAFADGVTQVFQQIRAGKWKLPDGIIGIEKSAFTDWTPVDTLAIGRLQTYLLSDLVGSDLDRQALLDAARASFSPEAADPLVKKRVGLERDLLRFAPADPATTTSGYPRSKEVGPAAQKPKPSVSTGARAAAAPIALTAAWRKAVASIKAMIAPRGFGSNNWGVMPSRSATGHTLIASDPHLSLSAPSVFWPVSLSVHDPKDPGAALELAGLMFPGIPGIILGHTDKIAWGATVAGYDVTDIYQEKLTADGKAVVFEGKEVPLEYVDEVIAIQGRDPYTYKVPVVPHHGPIVPSIQHDHTVAPLDPKAGALSYKWTGLEATHEVEAVFGLMRAKNVDDARQSLKQFGVGAQNWMIGDTSGNVLWTSHAHVPVRDPRAFTKWDPATYDGAMPCFVLPGDGTAEWKGYLADDLVPWLKNPPAGFISTANSDPTGDTLDNDPTNDKLKDGTPMYLSCTYDLGFREGRIHARFDGHPGPMTLDDLSAIQGDHRSPMGVKLAEALATAIDRAEEERAKPGTHADLAEVVKDAAYDADTVGLARTLIRSWGKDSDYEAADGMDLDKNVPLEGASGAEAKAVAASQATLLFDVWLHHVVTRIYGDEVAAMKGPPLDAQMMAKSLLHLTLDDPATLATFDKTTGDSALWDDMTTPAVESRHERMIRALLDALAWIEKTEGKDPKAWRWGKVHTLRFEALVPVFGKLSIPPVDDPVFPDGFPRHGDPHVVDACGEGPDPLSKDPTFSYGSGPTQRFVVDLDPSGIQARSALPGGVVWDHTSPHFRDEAELWRKNQTHPIPFSVEDVVAAKESRTVLYTAP
jgi:penicillin amidase